MNVPDSGMFEFIHDLHICRILNGMWQVSGAHGPIEPKKALSNMMEYHESGFTSWDLADHYGPAEDFIGEFRRELSTSSGTEALSGIQAFTKWVPRPGPVSKKFVEENILLSLKRMNAERLDLVQFHWWDYEDKNYLDALRFLSDLRDDGKIRHLGLTNFDTEHLTEIVDQGITIVSNQVQFSVVDRRPEASMIKFCKDHNIHLLTYGTLCGGLLSEKYLGQPEPQLSELDTASLRKYKQMVDAWGGWNLFQELLNTLKWIANKHQVSIANVAVRYILDKRAVAGVIIGVRLGLTDHRADNVRVFNFNLDNEDQDMIEAVHQKSRDLYRSIGDCGDEYR